MANRGIEVSDSPVDIAADSTLLLSAGSEYTIQNQSYFWLWTLETSAATIDPESAAVRLARIGVAPWTEAIIKPTDGNQFFVWYSPGGTGSIALNEA